MFERRLRTFWILLTLTALALVARLIDIQLVNAETYEQLAAQRMTRPVRYLRPPRGGIFDRNGVPLVTDEPASDVSIHFAVLSGQSERYLREIARGLRARGDYPAGTPTEEIVAGFYLQISTMWQRLTELTGISLTELLRRGERIQARVDRIKQAVEVRTGRRQRVMEENQWHPLIEGIDNALALDVREELERFAWLRVSPSSRRVAHDADTLVHILGRLGGADPKRIESDPLRDQTLRELRAGDQCGISGAERLAETTLRGTRGRIVEDFSRTELEHIDPVRGRDVYLTIDAALQKRIAAVLEQAVLRSKNPSGGAAVVIDVATRELLALVSYPFYPYDDYGRSYDTWRRDQRWNRLRFRAVSNVYPPGSTCKVITLYGALAEGLVLPESTIDCTGFFTDKMPNAFRCWYYRSYGALHGPQTASEALRNSCNIYFYAAADKLGHDRLFDWFSRFGLGRSQGTGLIEEANGLVPTAEWILRNRGRRPVPGDRWNAAIGQGDMGATPLQAANVVATVVSGQWAPVRLLRNENGGSRANKVPESHRFDERYLRTLREGMWRVVNERGATGDDAELSHARYELCGKTGSAQTSRRVVLRRYECEWEDGRKRFVTAPEKQDAWLLFPEDRPKRVRYVGIQETFPAGVPGELPAHAWFIGFTQRKDTPRGERPRGKAYAISVIIEFGSSGGSVAAPVAKRIAEIILEDE